MGHNFHTLTFIKSAVKVDGAPPDPVPWICMAGRSNVGKSSLINALANRKKLARVAATPGKTALLNFFDLDNKAMLVDLPGYGFAAVSKQEKARWGVMMEEFFQKAVKLRGAVLIVDARHEPSKDDVQMRDYMLSSNLPFVLAANKADKLKGRDKPLAAQRMEEFAQGHPYYFCSAEKKTGLDELKAAMTALAI
ncbi:MAG: ribosome biogenesis GTP-binding protein YihA/YsxC [Oscillospiraceae bacterium]|nr:ribosome biogenesis GTP-binding protein YihA/YsxC [Oscillospiraceae bacterium]